MKRLTRIFLSLIFISFFSISAFAQVQNISFLPSVKDFSNPERGFWRLVSDDFIQITKEDLEWAKRDNLRLIYALVRLDEYRNKELSEEFLSQLQNSFDKVQKARVKVILRFAYNYPQNSHDYENAKDASLGVILGHIKQLELILKVNSDLILTWQAGFIGAWGEGHTSSNGLENLKAKKAVLDALSKVAGNEIYLAWRYPADLMAWFPTIQKTAKIGIHNDCFLSSNTDVGTYSEDKEEREKQRNYVAKLSALTPFTGETCDAEKRKSRLSCEAILKEGAKFHLTSLGRDYDLRFHKNWKKEGCFGKVARKMGYRFELKEASAPNSAYAGELVKIKVKIANIGWAKIYKKRPIILIAKNKASGVEYKIGGGELNEILPNEAVSFSFNWKLPNNIGDGIYDLYIAAPDASNRLNNEPAYAVRFANDDNQKNGQGWSAKNARFALGLSVDIW